MIIDNRELNSCICKCGSITCRNIHTHSFKNQIPKNGDLVYSTLHHKSLRVQNSRVIVVDRCCGNCLHFHCSKCHESFSITKAQSSKPRFILGFSSNCLTHLEPTNCNENVIIPEFPIALRSFVSLIEQKENKSSDFNKSPHILNYQSKYNQNDETDEILSFDSDEALMFGRDQTEMVIGKYNEASISSFRENFQIINNSYKNCECYEDDEICSFDSDEDIMFGQHKNDIVIGKYNEPSISSYGQIYSTI